MPPFSPADSTDSRRRSAGILSASRLSHQLRAQVFGDTAVDSEDAAAARGHSEERLHANAEKAAAYESAYDKLIAASNYDKAAKFLNDPVKLAYRNSHSWLTRMLYDLQTIDRETSRMRGAKGLSEGDRRQHLTELAQARTLLLRAADALDRLLTDIRLGINKTDR
jgi:hypothetical protein